MERVGTSSGGSLTKYLFMGLSLIVALFFFVQVGRVFENVNADEIVVIQAPFSGQLTWYTSPGVKYQGFGTVTPYKKRSIYQFEAPVQFNDGGKGTIHGSVQYDLPLDVTNLTALHTRFGSMDAIGKQVMEVVTDKVVYMTGPLMSSRESYAEKKNYLISYVQDQIDNGVYQTKNATRVEKDQFTGLERTVTFAEIITGTDGRPSRQEQSVVGEFGIHAFNFSISKIDYDETVEKQIQQQQQITMDVQTSVADALKAQQVAITVEQQGKAAAAQAKWEQEVIKAKAVTEGESKLAVATLANQEAEQYRQMKLKQADADSTYRRQMMSANGALDQKLAAYIEVNKNYATAIEKHPGSWVPQFVSGGNSNSNPADALISLFTAKTAKELAVDISPGNSSSTPDVSKK